MRWGIATLCATVLFGCGRSPYAGYSVVGDNVHFHLRMIGEGEVLPTDSDSVRLRIRMGPVDGEPGSIFSTERTYSTGDLRQGAMLPVIGRMHVGDSISVIAPAAAWPWSAITQGADLGVPDTDMVRTELSVLDLRTPAMIRAEAAQQKRNDPEGYERRLIAAYLSRSGSPFIRWGTSDVHYAITGTAVDTAAIRTGDQVTLTYKGRRLEDGGLFDDTETNGAPLSFIIGDKDQVINGVEVVLHLLRAGQQCEVVLPSPYAFGTRGIPGVLEPNMPVVYTVRLVGVVRGAGLSVAAPQG